MILLFCLLRRDSVFHFGKRKQSVKIVKLWIKKEKVWWFQRKIIDMMSIFGGNTSIRLAQVYHSNYVFL